jgi:hypothetical protein
MGQRSGVLPGYGLLLDMPISTMTDRRVAGTGDHGVETDRKQAKVTFTHSQAHQAMSVLHTFYTAFAQRDHAVMGGCYHPQASFSDPVFPDLDAEGVKAMWTMLLSGDTDLCISFTVLRENEKGGRVRWEAFYSFGKQKRKVHNVITSEFTFKSGLIHTQRDRFGLWRWSRQALGLSGVFLGWTPMVKRKVQAMAAARLQEFRTKASR